MKMTLVNLTLIASSLFASGQSFAAVAKPRTLKTSVAVKTPIEQNAFLKTLVDAQEKINAKTGKNAQGEEVSFYQGDESNCTLAASPDQNLSTLTCAVAYNIDRWNGNLSVVLLVNDGKATEVLYEAFDGNY